MFRLQILVIVVLALCDLNLSVNDKDNDGDLDLCCGTPLQVPDDDDVEDRCRKEADKLYPKDMFTDKTIYRLNREACTAECETKIKASNIYNADKSINKEAYIANEVSVFKKDQDFEFHKKLLENAYDGCLTEVQKEVKSYPDVKCDLINFGLHLCLYRDAILKCPEEKQVKTEFCNFLRGHVKNLKSVFDEV